VGWQKRLIHAFGNEQALNAMIARLASPDESAVLDGTVAGFLATGDASGLEAHIESVMEATGYSTHASRSPAEITARLMDKQALASTRLSAKSLEALKRFLALDVPLDRAAQTLSDFARSAGLDIRSAQARFEARLGALSERGEDLSSIRWRAAFGRPLDYYTGLVFEIVAGEASLVLAGGGRYDRLMALLGAQAPIPAVGFSLWLDRIETVRANS
jgi:ATP phosphoribosyltransferase regulatory subunit